MLRRGFIESVMSSFSFSGRAGRLEYWVVTLLCIAVVLVPGIVFLYTNNNILSERYVDIASIITLWPLISVQARRWHDRNKSSLWLLMNFVPIIGFIWVIFENGFLPGVDKDNRY